jgi:class 3 adenylate cyclase
VDQRVEDDIREAIDIFTRSKNGKGLLLARLEAAEFKFLVNQVDECLEISLNIENLLKSKKMYKELAQVWFLAARTYRKLLDYEQAELKLNDLFTLAKENQLESEALMADALFEMGAILYAVNEEARAIEFFRKSAKVGMVLGIKNIIIRAFEAVRAIDRHKASELLTADLVYEDAMFARNRLSRVISPFRENRTKVKLFASTLFVDIVDFSRMMKKSDEDMVIRMVDELIDRMYLIIYQHNGYIDKFLGDGFMAIFEHGTNLSPQVVLGAVTAGMDIHRALNHKNRKLRKIYGSDKNIQVRIGISTGEIYAMLLGNYIKTEFTYLGNSVNLASKLESRATEQCMLIDSLSHDQVKERIISDPEDIFIPGLGKTQAYKVLRLARMQDRPSL